MKLNWNFARDVSNGKCLRQTRDKKESKNGKIMIKKLNNHMQKYVFVVQCKLCLNFTLLLT